MKNKLKVSPLNTDLIGKTTVKTDEVIDFLGNADELSANIMLVENYVEDEKLKNELTETVRVLSAVMGETVGGKAVITEVQLDALLAKIEYYEKDAAPFESFVLPGTTPDGARFHVLRTVARRAERSYAKVYEKYGGNDYIFEYLNKLSTYFFDVAVKFDSGK